MIQLSECITLNQMSDLIVFIRNNIDGGPNLLSTIENNTNTPQHEALVNAYSEFMRKYGQDYARGNKRTDTEDFQKVSEEVQAFKQLAIDEEIEDLVLQQTPSQNAPITALPARKSMSEEQQTYFATPAKKKPGLSNLYNISDDEDSTNENDDQQQQGTEYLTYLTKEPYNLPQNSDDEDVVPYRSTSIKASKRANKTMETVRKKLKEGFEYNNKQQYNTSEFRDSLWNILINGNYRVKFSPKCATRTGAAEYCKRKFDPSGYPLYRLIPANTRERT